MRQIYGGKIVGNIKNIVNFAMLNKQFVSLFASFLRLRSVNTRIIMLSKTLFSTPQYCDIIN